MRQFLPVIGMFALAACEPAIPDSGAGVGFGDYNQYMRAQSAQGQPAGAQAESPQPTTGAPLSAIPSLGEDAAAQGLAETGDLAADDNPDTLARDALAAIGGQSDAASASTDVSLSPQGDDTWVPGAEAEYEERADIPYETVRPEPLPERPGDTTNIVAYALSTSHQVGQQRHQRSPIQFRNHERACAQFASQDLAQEEFLRRGGPERDPLNLDPDGDGFACWWDPEPFRAAARGAADQ